MPRSQARVHTDRPQRYAKQLAAHLGRKVESNWDEKAGTGSVAFSFGTATLPRASLLAPVLLLNLTIATAAALFPARILRKLQPAALLKGE